MVNGFVVVYECGIVYCDIKLVNLFFDENGVVKVVDLGLVRFFEIKDENCIDMVIWEGVIVGIFVFMLLE